MPARMDHPLCVDLDGTLLRVDTFWESLVLLWKHHPLLCLRVPLWLLKGKAHLKEQIDHHVELGVHLLPVNPSFLEYLTEQKDSGRTLILVTGAPHKTAHRVSERFGIFSEVLSTHGSINLTGSRKAEELVRRFGEKGFDYAGNAPIDLKVWPRAQNSIVVNGSKALMNRARKVSTVVATFDPMLPLWKTLLKAVRWHQWSKNLLLLVPVVTAHALTNQTVLLKSALAFVAFCLVTSGVYLTNDLLDLEADRIHVRKRRRPLASGNLSIRAGATALPLFLALGLGIATFIGFSFLGVLLAYVVLTFAYSLALKRMVFVDVCVLAVLYTLRIVAGHEATNIAYSDWLLLFALFFFLSLALIKRYCELLTHHLANRSEVSGRGYMSKDHPIVRVIGLISAGMAVSVLAFYVQSEHVRSLYVRPTLLWVLVPIILGWLLRVWVLASRGKVHDDPVIFALKDWFSYLLGALCAVVLVAAS